jgi:uncharacterized membrane protein YphA (DoxX/SURF4 family)
MKNNFTFNSDNVLRIGISLVMLWFGTMQIISPENWTGFLPGITNSLPLSQITFIYLNGIFEIIFGLLMMFNIWKKLTSGLLAIHMLGIVFTLLSQGSNAIAVRDFAIFVALVSIFLQKDIVKPLAM